MALPRAGPFHEALPLFESLAPTLEDLDLSSNKGLGGRIPGEIGKFTKLTTLVLSSCGLEGACALSTSAQPIERLQSRDRRASIVAQVKSRPK